MYVNVLICRNHDYRIVEQFLRYIHNFKTLILFLLISRKEIAFLLFILFPYTYSNSTGIGKAYFDKLPFTN